jgi:NAD(P)-dependent dehydrogenase (short-subunit alcohol dehydrogenase family)
MNSEHLPSFSLDGKIVVVTGASRGIGRGLVDALAAAGATVALTARSYDEASTIAAEVVAAGGRASGHVMDVADIGSINAAFDDIAQQHGRVDVLVANAGLGANHPAVDVTEADWDDMMDVNAKGLFVYCASKGAVNQLVRVLALEWGPHGITVNAVAPTFIYTPGTAERLDDPEFRRGVVDRIPMGDVGTIADVAGAVIYLASDAAAMVNGIVLPVDGGWTAQ